MANFITLFRTFLGLTVVLVLYYQQASATMALYWVLFGLTAVVILLDGVDGYVARRFNEESQAGAVIDIIGDRIVEQIYWIAYLAVGWVPLWIPLVVIVRGVAVDGLRSIALEKGLTAFGSSTMMKSRLGVLLVSSRFSRWTYAVVKGVAFGFLILAHMPDGEASFLQVTKTVAYTSVYVTVFFCVVRGLPVVFESRRFFSSASSS